MGQTLRHTLCSNCAREPRSLAINTIDGYIEDGRRPLIRRRHTVACHRRAHTCQARLTPTSTTPRYFDWRVEPSGTGRIRGTDNAEMLARISNRDFDESDVVSFGARTRCGSGTGSGADGGIGVLNALCIGRIRNGGVGEDGSYAQSVSCGS